MTPEEREALLAGYALGSLSDPDARDAVRLIRSDDAAAQEYEGYRELADLIALSVPMHRADPRLRDRVIAAARRSSWRTRRNWRRYLPVAGAAAALLLVSLWAISLQTTISGLRAEQAALAAVVEADAKRLEALANRSAFDAERTGNLGVRLETALRDQQLILAVQADPEARLTELQATSAAHGGIGRYIWSDDYSAGVLLVNALPPLPVGASYRVWLEDGQSRTVIAQLFETDHRGDASMVLAFDRDERPVRLYVVVLDSDGATGPVVLHGRLSRSPLLSATSTPQP